ncbi:MAG: hypothetical protein P8Y80_04450 [Acidobacteriota bacterium]|jgi:hypothetical protein
MAETIAAFVIIGRVIFLHGRSFYRNMTGKEGYCAYGVKACSSSGCCNQIMEKMYEE